MCGQKISRKKVSLWFITDQQVISFSMNSRILLYLSLVVADRAYAQQPTTIEWGAYGRSAGGDRFSPAAQINRDNVKDLVPVWTYRTGELDAKTRRPAKLEVTPLMVDGTLYISTPLGKVAALNPLTGKQIWKVQADVDANSGWGDFTSRGGSTGVDRSTPRNAPCHRTIF